MELSAKQVLAREAADWYQRGIIGKDLNDILQLRYDRRGLMFASLLKWLGFFGLVMLVCFVLGFVGSMVRSYFLTGVMFACLAIGIGFYARVLALDPRRRHPVIASILFTVATNCVYAALLSFDASLTPKAYGDSFFVTALFLTSVISFVVAYSYRLIWPLLLALLFLFNGIGSWQQYMGHSINFFLDPKAMSVIAAMIAAFGLFHERRLEEVELKTHIGFGHLFIIFGLLYLNVSIWILSIHPGGLSWVLAFSALSLAQIVIGAKLKDSRFTGFGIVFLSIDMFTRMFEALWHRASADIFFLSAGVIGLSLGYLFERVLCSSELEVIAK